MNRLPPEMLTMILSEISLKERVRLREVNTLWRDVIDEIKVNRLVLIGDDRSVFNQRWFYSNLRNRLDDPDLVMRNPTKGIPEQFTRANLSHLKRLFIDLSGSTSNSCGAVNHFEHLEELNLFNMTVTENVTINLPKLRILSVHHSPLSDEPSSFRTFATIIGLQTPRLTAFRCRSLMDYEVFYPNRLTYLDAGCTKLCYIDLDTIRQFRNLEYLYCCEIPIYEPLLDELPKLKEIHTRRRYIEILYRLDQDRARLRRSDLRLFQRGIELSDYQTYRINPPLNEAFSAQRSAFYAQHYSRLVWTSSRPIDDLELLCSDSFNRTNLWLKHQGEYPADLFDKFNIKSLKVVLPKSEKRLLQLIGRCSNLNEVTFQSPPSEDLLSRLAELQPTITKLKFSYRISLECILKFKYLMYLSLEKKLSSFETIHFIKCLFEQAGYFREFCFNFANFSCTILRASRVHFKVHLAGDEDFQRFQSLEEVLDFLRQRCQLEAPTNLIEYLIDCLKKW